MHVPGTIEVHMVRSQFGSLVLTDSDEEESGGLYVTDGEVLPLAKALLEKHFEPRVVRRIRIEVENLEPQFEEVEL